MRQDRRGDGCPLSGVKQTCRFALHMSAFDPEQTLTSVNVPAEELPAGLAMDQNAHVTAPFGPSLGVRPRFPEPWLHCANL